VSVNRRFGHKWSCVYLFCYCSTIFCHVDSALCSFLATSMLVKNISDHKLNSRSSRIYLSRDTLIHRNHTAILCNNLNTVTWVFLYVDLLLSAVDWNAKNNTVYLSPTKVTILWNVCTYCEECPDPAAQYFNLRLICQVTYV
jgi:hypothetical protein